MQQTADKTDHPRQSHTPLALLLPLVKPYRWQLAGGVTAMAVSSLTTLALGWGLKTIVDNGLNDASGALLNRALLVLLVVIILMAGASFTRLQLIYRTAERVTAELRKKIFAHLLGLDPAYFDKVSSGDQIARINADTTVLQLVITNNLPAAFRHSVMLTGGVIMLFTVSPGMTAMALLAVPVMIFPAIYFGRRVRAKSRDAQNRIGDISAYGHEAVQGLQTIQAYGYESYAAGHFNALADETFAAAMQYIRTRAVLSAFIIAVIFGAIGILLWAGGHRVLAGTMTGGELSAFIFYAGILAGSVTALSEAMSEFNRASGAADRIADVLVASPSVRGASSTMHFPLPASAALALKDVTFSYPARPEHAALDRVSFDAPAGSVVALVGPSGAGKTTIFQLLQRFYDPQAGMISINGADITTFPPSEIRAMLGVVAQDPAIFSTTVADNIRLGNPQASDADVREAARMAQALDFITALPQGFDTVVGERGNRLSGGQKQRIAIARALLKNPRILLLDEATSALDAANEVAVHQALKTLMQGRTTLIIAHRLSTVQGADKIIVLDQGRIAASGSHSALYGTNGLYTHLAGLQLQESA